MTITTDLNTHLSQIGSVSEKSRSKTISAALLISASGLAALSFSRRGWQRIALAAAGGYLAYEGFSQTSSHVGKVRVSYTIAREPEEVYKFVRNSENWPKFIPELKIQPEKNSFMMSLGRTLGLELRSHAEITEQEEGRFIAWSSFPGMLEHRGVIHFLSAPGGRGTEVAVALEYNIPGRLLSEGWAFFRGNAPEQSVRETLRSLKQIMECGEIATVIGQPAGKRGMKGAALRVLYREPQSETISAPTQAQLAGD
jgi:uncharacterized membrane protein